MSQSIENSMYDVVIIGGGPAGLTAALYLARAKYKVVVLEKEQYGGQIRITSEVVNYPGVEITDGKKLTETMRIQAQKFGAEFMLTNVDGLKLDEDIKVVKTSRGEIKCYGVILATGAHPRVIGFPGEEKFKGRGVAYCATCDGEFFTGKDVFVIGGGFAAAEEAVFLTKYAKHVTILVRKDDFSCAKSVADEARKHEKITVLTNTEVVEALGDEVLESLKYKNNVTGEVTEYKANNNEGFGIFVFAGYEPATALVKGIADLDEYGYIVTDRNQKTNVDGLYAAGDVCQKNLRQVVTATSDGAIAATELERYVSMMQAKVGIVPKRVEVEQKETPQNQPTAATSTSSSALFDNATVTQLNTVFSRMANKLKLKLFLNESAAANELKAYMEEFTKLTDKLTVEISNEEEQYAPCVRLYTEDDKYTGLAFHGVPGGHEFTSFVLGIYNASGEGQAIDAAIKEKISKITDKTNLKVFVSLSCTMCPELVVSAQKIASMNENVTAEVFDLTHYPDLRDKYKVMSVPCMVLNDDKVTFGKKNHEQILNWLGY
ncbi:MAG: FAD-dependent oxidoreductase [Ruminobacter sp.]|nr:FAD-dependent oxidoreductase [Ruminobacter sp.]